MSMPACCCHPSFPQHIKYTGFLFISILSTLQERDVLKYNKAAYNKNQYANCKKVVYFYFSLQYKNCYENMF